MKSFVTETLSIPTPGADGQEILLHAEAAGPQDGPLVVLLHGFPEFWYGWKEQIAPLAQSGFRVVMPDQRGYNLSSKPRGVAAYAITKTSADVIAILDALGREKAAIIGHDWGGVVAWHTAIHYPERVERLAILNAPHPAAMARALTRLTRQILSSWYIYFFQIPRLPEFLLSLGKYAPMRRMLRATAKSNTFSKEDLVRYTEAWAHPGALTAMINWYRAFTRTALSRGRSSYLTNAKARVSMPTLILWGERDAALIPQLAQWSLEYCDQGELVRFADATHWVQHDAAERVTSRLLDHIEDLLKSAPV